MMSRGAEYVTIPDPLTEVQGFLALVGGYGKDGYFEIERR